MSRRAWLTSLALGVILWCVIMWCVIISVAVAACRYYIALEPQSRLTVECDGRVLYRQMDIGRLEVSCARGNLP